ncbi:nucleotidyltransferase family protein, partial [bacterium]|nr:nucleotidyltransferase family protein [bacterium]
MINDLKTISNKKWNVETHCRVSDKIKIKQGKYMKAIIPAAGMGNRLRPHTHTYPKVMLNVAGKPILAHIVEDLIQNGFDEITIIVGYRKDVIINYFKDKYPATFSFPVQKEMLGLGHAIKYGLDKSSEPALILLGDTIFQTDLSRFNDL